MSRETELAWAAGFFDGEGCTHFGTRMSGRNTKRYRQLRMSVSQSEQSTLKRFQAALGFGRIEGPHQFPSLGPNAKPKSSWRADGLDLIQAAALMLWPYLSGPKREQIEVAFEKYRNHKPEVPPSE